MMFLVFVLLVSQCSSLTSQQCHHCEQTSCDCSSQNLGEVPADASKLIAELDLSFNTLETIMKDDFLSYVALRALFVNNNRIKTIHEEAFHPLISLEKLDLSANQLETLSSGWFQNLISLHYLNLLGNKYTTLGQGNLFLPLRSLKTLHFGGPFLQSVSKRDFSGLFGLEELVFEGNDLQVYDKGSLRQIGPIRSEWCKYELDYTHFRLFDQNDDAVVLILLEPIDKNNIPKKFIRLRKVMNSRTYLEWPDDEDQIPAFWQSLKTAIKPPDIDNKNDR